MSKRGQKGIKKWHFQISGTAFRSSGPPLFQKVVFLPPFSNYFPANGPKTAYPDLGSRKSGFLEALSLFLPSKTAKKGVKNSSKKSKISFFLCGRSKVPPLLRHIEGKKDWAIIGVFCPFSLPPKFQVFCSPFFDVCGKFFRGP